MDSFHCNISGNETADALAKEASGAEQEGKATTYTETRTIIKARQHNTWLQNHPNYNPKDPYHALTRSEQVIIFRLRTGHNRLNHHLYTRFRIGQSGLCPCQTGNQTVIHLLQHCPMYDTLRDQMWPVDSTMAQKLHGEFQDLRRTAAFVHMTGLSI